MNFKVIPPPQHLADYVRFFWFAEANALADKPYIHRAFAYPCPELIFCYKGQFNQIHEFDEKPLSSAISGQTQTFSEVISRTNFGVFGFYLYPHALPQLFGIPADELTNQSTDIKSILGKDGEILEQKIMLASCNNRRVEIASGFLEERLKNAKLEYKNIISSILTISNLRSITSVKELADTSNLSLRQFERKFKEFSGFTPKLFMRIIRFNSLLNKSFPNKSLTEIAYEHAYYDQSHFIHDFQNFSGYNPKEYFKKERLAASDRGTVEF